MNNFVLSLKESAHFDKNVLYSCSECYNSVSSPMVDVVANNSYPDKISVCDPDFVVMFNINNEIIDLLSKEYKIYDYSTHRNINDAFSNDCNLEKLNLNGTNVCFDCLCVINKEHPTFDIVERHISHGKCGLCGKENDDLYRIAVTG